MHEVSHWILDRIVAEQWRYGDIFLAGDAAHRQPPTSGLGLNTGIQDAHNTAWKLAEVLAGRATDALLDSYEAERKPVSTHGADWALLAFIMNHFIIDAGVGLIPGAPPAAAWSDAAAKATAELGVTIEVVGIDQDGSAAHLDAEGTWPALRGTDDGGAVLVRPDQFVAWRVPTAPADPTVELTEALRHALAVGVG